MNHNPLIAQVIFTIVIIASVVGLIYVVKPFLLPKKQKERGITITRSARNQQNLIGRRSKE